MIHPIALYQVTSSFLLAILSDQMLVAFANSSKKQAQLTSVFVLRLLHRTVLFVTYFYFTFIQI